MNDDKLIWTRRIDHEAQRARRRKFLNWFVAPAAIAIAGTWLLLDAWSALGLFILLALFGLLLGTWVWAKNLVLRQNRELFLRDGQHLVLGRAANARSFDLRRVEAWTTKMGVFRTVTHVPSRSAPVSGSMPTAEVLFRYPIEDDGVRGVRADGGDAYELQSFFWISMPESELDEVREVLEPLIDAPWVEPERLKS